MEKINFINNSQPAVNDTNLNKLQDNVENAISETIESSNNANDNYIKYADGTMICTGSYTGNIAINNSLGSIYRSSTISFNDFAQPFTRLDSIDFNLTGGTSGNFAWLGTYGDYNPNLTNPGRCVLFSGVSVPSSEMKITYIAIGKWK